MISRIRYAARGSSASPLAASAVKVIAIASAFFDLRSTKCSAIAANATTAAETKPAMNDAIILASSRNKFASGPADGCLNCQGLTMFEQRIGDRPQTDASRFRRADDAGQIGNESIVGMNIFRLVFSKT